MKTKVRYGENYRIIEYWGFLPFVGYCKIYEIKEDIWFNPYWTFKQIESS